MNQTKSSDSNYSELLHR